MLVSLVTQVQSQILLDPHYLSDYLSFSYDFGTTFQLRSRERERNENFQKISVFIKSSFSPDKPCLGDWEKFPTLPFVKTSPFIRSLGNSPLSNIYYIYIYIYISLCLSSLYMYIIYCILYIIVRLLNHSVLPRSYNLNKRRYKKVEEETQRVFVMCFC